MDDESISGPLWPLQLMSLLGESHSIEAFAARAGVSVDKMVRVFQALENLGFAKLVLTPVCPDCGMQLSYYEDPDEIPAEVGCTVCLLSFPIDDVEVKLVYLLSQTPEE